MNKQQLAAKIREKDVPAAIRNHPDVAGFRDAFTAAFKDTAGISLVGSPLLSQTQSGMEKKSERVKE